MVQATEQTIRQVVQEVLIQLAGRGGSGAPSAAANRWGVFDSVDDAVAACEAKLATRYPQGFSTEASKNRPDDEELPYGADA